MVNLLMLCFLYTANFGCSKLAPSKSESKEAAKASHDGGYISAKSDRAGDKAEASYKGREEGTPKSDVISTTDKEAAPKPAAAVADPIVGREKIAPRAPKDKGPPAGILTAGSFDDNIDPEVFSKFVRKMGQRPVLGELPSKLQGQRVMVIVRDAAGRPMGNARVKLSAGAAAVEVVTRSDGRAIFMLSLDHLPAGQALLATVTGPNGGNPVTETITAGSSRWEVTLPTVQAQLPKSLDLCIVLDTTGSMGKELDYLKSEIRSISSAVRKQFPEVKQRLALVLYRDDGDEYVVRPFDFTDSLDLFHKRLAAQRATGGGDIPEAMHRGLEESLQLRWNDDPDTARVLFLIADAPPHAQHMNRTLAAADALRKKGVALYPVASGSYDDTCEFVMRSCMISGSRFLFLTDDSGVGGSHLEPSIPYYQVERLERLMIRTIAGELAGQQIHANPADILRTVGKKVN
jgi:Mg-chelatase subunit ChlD